MSQTTNTLVNRLAREGGVLLLPPVPQAPVSENRVVVTMDDFYPQQPVVVTLEDFMGAPKPQRAPSNPTNYGNWNGRTVVRVCHTLRQLGFTKAETTAVIHRLFGAHVKPVTISTGWTDGNNAKYARPYQFTAEELATLNGLRN